MAWIDRGDPRGRTYRIRVAATVEICEGSIGVQSYGDYFADYRRHPERKLADADGGRAIRGRKASFNLDTSS